MTIARNAILLRNTTHTKRRSYHSRNCTVFDKRQQRYSFRSRKTLLQRITSPCAHITQCNQASASHRKTNLSIHYPLATSLYYLRNSGTKPYEASQNDDPFRNANPVCTYRSRTKHMRYDTIRRSYLGEHGRGSLGFITSSYKVRYCAILLMGKIKIPATCTYYRTTNQYCIRRLRSVVSCRVGGNHITFNFISSSNLSMPYYRPRFIPTTPQIAATAIFASHPVCNIILLTDNWHTPKVITTKMFTGRSASNRIQSNHDLRRTTTEIIINESSSTQFLFLSFLCCCDVSSLSCRLFAALPSLR